MVKAFGVLLLVCVFGAVEVISFRKWIGCRNFLPTIVTEKASGTKFESEPVESYFVEPVEPPSKGSGVSKLLDEALSLLGKAPIPKLRSLITNYNPTSDLPATTSDLETHVQVINRFSASYAFEIFHAHLYCVYL